MTCTNIATRIGVALAMAGGLAVGAVGPSLAAPTPVSHIAAAASSPVATVRWHRGAWHHGGWHHRGWAPGAVIGGLALGALGAAAGAFGGGYYGPYGYGYGYGPYGYAYAPGPYDRYPW